MATINKRNGKYCVVYYYVDGTTSRKRTHKIDKF